MGIGPGTEPGEPHAVQRAAAPARTAAAEVETMGSKQADVIVVGCGIAGLGVAALLADRGMKVLCLERDSQVGGRLQSFALEGGWKVDIGLHMTELGEHGAASELCRRVGRPVAWPPFSETVQFFQGGQWKNVAELVQLSPEDKRLFGGLLQRITLLTDAEIASQDATSLEDWMTREALPVPVRRLLSLLSMIMTTLPHPSEQAAGEVLFIARENLLKKRQVLSANYPLGGMAGITGPLREAIESRGGEIRLGCEVQEVVVADGAVRGVRVPRKSVATPYPPAYGILETETLSADTVVCALPTYQLHRILDLHPARTPFPSWWVRWIRDPSTEVTGLAGYILGLREPVTDLRCFFCALELPRSGLAFQAFPASNYDPSIAPAGKQLLHTDVVIEYEEACDPFTVRARLEALWEDLALLFPGIWDKVEFRIPYRTAGCDGLARKPGLVGGFKPDVEAPGVRGLYFAGDTYRGRGLAMNGAARSAMICADRILEGAG